jgi:DNA polymerase III gamma/tau subunit
MPSLYEHYRPGCMREVIGQTVAKRQIRTALGFGWGGKAWWFYGPSGSGKTTMVNIVARMGAEDFYITEFDSGHELNTEVLNDIEEHMHYSAPGKGGRAYIVNEAHGLRAPIVRRLLGLLERLPQHVAFFFTTTAEGQLKLFDDNVDAGPLLSRCVQVEVSNKMLTNPFARHAKWIAKREKLDGRPLQDYIELVERCNGNLRMVLQEIQAGCMSKKP